ncbi:hypothetical protein GX411_01015 [Candidatus Fermentibacteria bacterium]|nr:hypothetical protein [Candidatus Fermentibacteria bacterium]
MRRPAERGGWLVALALVSVLSASVYWSVLSSPRLPGGDLSDTVHQGYPFLQFTRQALLEGRLPHWNPFIYCGIPFYSSFSAPVAYPVRGALLLAGAEAAVRFLFPVHLVIGGMSAWLLLGAMGVSRQGRLAGALAFAAGAWANTLFYAGHGSKIICWSYLPLLLFSCERWLSTRRFWFVALGGLCFGMQALSSHPQMLLYSGIAALLWSAARSLQPRSLRKAAAAAGGLAAMTVLGLSVGAVQLLPGYHFSGQSSRGEDLSLDQSQSYSLPPEETLVMVFPRLFGYRHGFADSSAGGIPVYWGRLGLRLSSEFTGVSVALLALIGLLAGRSAFRWPLLAIFVTGLVVSWGGYTPVYSILYRLVPLFRKLRAPHMAAFLTTSALSLMAGPGFDALLEKGGRSWKAVLAFAAACLAAFAVAGPLVGGLQAGWWERMGAAPSDWIVRQRVDMAAGDFLRACVSAALVGLAGLLASRGRLTPGRALVPALVLISLELIPVDRDFQVFLPDTRVESVFPDYSRLAAAAGGGRVLPGGNEMMPSGVLSVAGYHAARTQANDDMLEMVSAGGLAGARLTAFTVLFESGAAVPYDSLVQAISGGPEGVPEGFESPQPRVFIAADWTVDPSSAGGAFDPGGPPPEKLTVLDVNPGIPHGGDSAGTARIVTDLPELVVVETSAGSPSVMVLADTWYPRWHAEVDGVEAPILRANCWQRAVAVPAGRHSVAFSFDHSDVRTGAIVSGAGVALIAAAGMLELLSHRRRA